METEPSWLEVILKKEMRENGIERVLSIKTEDVVGKGENYLSLLTRVKMRVVLGSGRITTRTVIVKGTIKDEKTAAYIENMGAFKKEITVIKP